MSEGELLLEFWSTIKQRKVSHPGKKGSERGT